ncbi:MAG: hypothetical protein JW751_28545 [Polyangiaceae bacterium]|nr:hypothetical protein [Polyangiaceae bacterium]
MAPKRLTGSADRHISGATRAVVRLAHRAREDVEAPPVTVGTRVHGRTRWFGLIVSTPFSPT